MEKKDIKDILEHLPAVNHSEQQGRIAKLWLFQLNNKNRVTIPESELNSSKAEVWKRLEGKLASHTGSVKLWPRIAAAVVILITVGLGITLYFYGLKQQTEIKSAYVNDIAPGRVGATLTLANGKKIRLADAANGELAIEAGIGVTKTADGQLVYQIKESSNEKGRINTLSTAKGETYMLILPDKSKVWLNAASTLTYANNLIEHGIRRVKLEGEGYFEVAKDKAHPFIVKTSKQEVEVLGTHFNINTYSSESNVRTTLLEGSVKISSSNKSKILKPNEQAVLTGDGNIKISEADAAVAVAWKNNQFMFDSENIQTVMRMVERWYDVDVEYVGDITDEKFWGGVSRFDNVSKVLLSLESTGKVHFKIEGRKIYVSK